MHRPVRAWEIIDSLELVGLLAGQHVRGEAARCDRHDRVADAEPVDSRPDGGDTAGALVAIGRAHLDLGQHPAALAPLQRADAFWREFDADNRWAGEAALWLGRCYRALGREAEADESLRRAKTILSHSELPADAGLLRLAGRS